MRTQVALKLDQIVENIYEKVFDTSTRRYDDLGLYTGESGVLLFLVYYNKYYSSSRCEDSLYFVVENILNCFSRNNSCTFCSGFSGSLYLFEFLREKKWLDIDVSDANDILDGYLVRCMRRDINNEYYDFLHGPLGICMYFLKRKNEYKLIKEFIDFLYDFSEKDFKNNIFKWKSIIHPEGQPGYNISLSHGMASLIIFFCRVLESGIQDDRIEEMLEGAINYIYTLELDFDLYGSSFPPFELISKDFMGKSRLGWCYGDLGIALSFWQAGKTLQQKRWKTKAIEVLMNSTKRLNPQNENVVDAEICHGSAGLFMIYYRMYLETGILEFKRTADYWMSQTLEHARFSDGIAGFKTKGREWICDYSLLSGVTGVGMSMISYLKDDDQLWDELFLLSNRSC